jgi:hypothetical protein
MKLFAILVGSSLAVKIVCCSAKGPSDVITGPKFLGVIMCAVNGVINSIPEAALRNMGGDGVRCAKRNWIVVVVTGEAVPRWKYELK